MCVSLKHYSGLRDIKQFPILYFIGDSILVVKEAGAIIPIPRWRNWVLGRNEADLLPSWCRGHEIQPVENTRMAKNCSSQTPDQSQHLRDDWKNRQPTGWLS